MNVRIRGIQLIWWHISELSAQSHTDIIISKAIHKYTICTFILKCCGDFIFSVPSEHATTLTWHPSNMQATGMQVVSCVPAALSALEGGD